jgi:hypothetical protein
MDALMDSINGRHQWMALMDGINGCTLSDGRH